MNKLLTILMLLTCGVVAQHSFASNTVIQGVAENIGQREIKLLKYSDYVSRKPEVIASARADQNGNFKLDFFLSTTEYIRLSVGFKEASLFVSPGAKINVHIDYGEKILRQRGSYPLQKPLDFLIKNEPDSSVNRLIFRFDSISGHILPENTMRMILYQRDYGRYDSLKKKIIYAMGNVRNSFVDNYMKYRFAQLETVLYSHNLTSIGERMLADQKILYRHIEYMYFFENYVDMYIPGKSDDITPADIDRGLNQIRPDYEVLDEVLGKDTVFRNEKVRELAALMLLKRSYHNKIYNPHKIINLLDDLRLKTKFNRHKEIAIYLKNQLLQYKRKNKLKDFTFPTSRKNNDSIRFSDFRGRYLLISFYQQSCMDCMLEMDIMQKLYDEHSTDIFLLSVFLDDNFKDFQKFAKNSEYEWNMVYFNHQYDLVKYFNLSTIPRYILVAPDGKIKRKYLPKLGEGGLEIINGLLKQF